MPAMPPPLRAPQVQRPAVVVAGSGDGDEEGDEWPVVQRKPAPAPRAQPPPQRHHNKQQQPSQVRACRVYLNVCACMYV